MQIAKDILNRNNKTLLPIKQKEKQDKKISQTFLNTKRKPCRSN